MRNDWVRLLGVRGSIPVSGAAYARYGGATTCALLYLDGQYLVLDAGSGLLHLGGAILNEPALPLILTHAHADHLLGFPLCPYLLRAGGRMDVYAVPRGGLDARAQVCSLLSPPLWPVGPESLPAAVDFHDLPASLRLGALTVERMEGVHPGGVSLLRVRGSEKTVGFLTDCTLTGELLPAIAEFARGCDLLLCDGQYSDAEWQSCSAFGHSTWRMAARLAAGCGAKTLRIIHHDPTHTDAVLDAATDEITDVFPNGAFAREGEEVLL